ncbi:MAG: LPS assembly protein LptD, partial [Nitrospirota bacterium]
MTTVLHKENNFVRGLALVVLGLAATVSLIPAAARAEDRLSEKMNIMANSKGKITIQAEQIEYNRNTNTYTAVGKVRITQGGSVLTSDKATLNEDTGDAEAIGKARLVTEDHIIFADQMKVNFDTKLGVIEQGLIFVKKGTYSIKGDVLDRVSENEYKVKKGELTTCTAKIPFWTFTSSDYDVQMNGDIYGKDVVLRIRDFPVLYLPVAWLPLLKPRTSGFLIPRGGYSSTSGVRFIDGYYWAPLDNFDTTLILDYRSKKGEGVSTDIRYALDKDTALHLYGYFMDDHQANTLQYNTSLKYQEAFSDSLSGKLNINLSNPDFFRDLTWSAADRTQVSLDSDLWLTNRWDWGRVYCWSEYTEGLLSASPGQLSPNDYIAQRVPEVGVNVVKKQLFDAPVYLDLDSSETYFSQRRGGVSSVSGGRFDVSPKVSGFFSLDGINISPQVGYRETAYDLSGNSPLDDERGLFGAGIKAQTDFSRFFNFDGGPLAAIKHTIVPLV